MLEWPVLPKKTEVVPEDQLINGHIYLLKEFAGQVGIWDGSYFLTPYPRGNEHYLKRQPMEALEDLGLLPPLLRDQDQIIYYIRERARRLRAKDLDKKVAIYRAHLAKFLDDKDYDSANTILKSMVLEEMETPVILMCLEQTLPHWEQLPDRPPIFDAARQIINNRGEMPMGYYTLERT